MPSIDLNSDAGESFGRWSLGDDAAMFESVSSANIACGFHAGDPCVMARACADAAAADVRIGAHVAYRDLAGFGRRFLDCTPTELADDIVYQIGALDAMARRAGTRVRYVKPHGALYHAIVRYDGHAQAVVDAVAAYDAGLALLLLPGSVAIDKAEAAGLRAVSEAFADRAYNPDGTLVSRREAGAVLEDVDIVTANMVRLVEQGTLVARDGSVIEIAADSICLHGDSPDAVAMSRAVRRSFEAAGITIESFA